MAPRIQRPRPVRAVAGRRSLPQGFVDTAENTQKFDDSSSDDEYYPIKRRASATPRRIGLKRRQTPPADQIPTAFNPPGTAIDYPANVSSDEELLQVSSKEAAYTIKVPKSAGSTITIKLKLEDPHSQSQITASNSDRPPELDPEEAVQKDTRDIGFLSLPAELRNNIYRRVFGDDHKINIRFAHNFQRSAALLRTCRLVYLEGTAVLYGTNEFVLQRDNRERGEYWESRWKEIGWKDVRRFLSALRPETLGLIKRMQVVFDDASRAGTPDLDTRDRYYWNDDNLVNVLKLLRTHSKLEVMRLHFDGHKRLDRDLYEAERFVHHLSNIRVGEVIVNEKPYSRFVQRQGGIGFRMADLLEKRMTR